MTTQTAFTRRYTFRLDPTDDQKTSIDKELGCGRKVWNESLGQYNAEYADFKNGLTDVRPGTSLMDFHRRFMAIKAREDLSYLKEVSYTTLQQKVIDLVKAFANYRRFMAALVRSKKKDKMKPGAGLPKFKKKGHRDSFNIVGKGSIHVNSVGVKIPKTDTYIPVQWTRELPSEPSSYTITKESTGEYYITFVCQSTKVRKSGTGRIGIDVGLKTYVAMSDGTKVANPKYYQKKQKRLKALQRRLSRRQKGGKNFEKTRKQVAKWHNKVANFRRDFIHKLTSKIVSENQVVTIEDLRVKNMTKHPTLGRHILRAAWGMFFRFLTYKVIESENTRLVVASAYFPSTRLCNHCGAKNNSLTLKDRTWTCDDCGTFHDRDFNASKNLEDLGRIKVEEVLARDPNCTAKIFTA